MRSGAAWFGRWAELFRIVKQLSGLFRLNETSKRQTGWRHKRPRFFYVISVKCRYIKHCTRAEAGSVEKEKNAEFCFAELNSTLQNGIEHRPKFSPRRTEDFEHLRGRGLLFQRLYKLRARFVALACPPIECLL